MTTWDRVQGDVKDTIHPKLFGITDLTTVDVVEAHVWKGSTRVSLNGAVLDAAARTLTIQLGTDGTGWLPAAEPGKWYVEYELTFDDGSILTWPPKPEDPKLLNTSSDWINVRAQGDP